MHEVVIYKIHKEYSVINYNIFTMRKRRKILMLLTFASFVLSIVACGNNDEQENEKVNLMAQFVGTWSGDIGDLYGINKYYKVVFTTRQDGTYTADDWVDEEGHGIFLHAGSCTNKWRAYILDNFSTAGNLYLDFDISSSLSDYPSVLCNVSLVKEVETNSFITFNDLTSDLLRFKRYSAPEDEKILGYWQCESVSGTYTDNDGILHNADDGSWLIKCIYLSDSGINGHEDYNGIIFHNIERKFPRFMKYSYNGVEISSTELSNKFVIDNLTEDKLIVSYKGQNGNKYLDFNITYKRVPTYDNK